MNDTASTLKAALKHHKDGDIDASVSCLKSAVEAGNRHELIVGMLASHYAEIGMASSAATLYEEILEKNPKNHLARFQLGHIHYSQKEYERALSTWEETLNVNEEFVTKLYAAKAHIAMGMHSRAKPLLARVIDNAPNGHPAKTEAEQILQHTDLGT